MGKGSKREKKHKSKGKNDFDFSDRKRKGRGKGKTKQDKNWDKYFKEFQDSLQPKGIYMRDVESDGNCLFRSIADHVDGDENEFQKYRDMAVEYITRNKEYFALFLLDDEKIEDYIKDMSEDGTWGGHFELVALSSLLNVKFCLHIKDGKPVIVKSSEKVLKNVKFVHLAYHVDEHYSSIRKIGDDAKTPAEPIPVDASDSESDEEDSTEGSDKEISSVTKEMEEVYIGKKDKKKMNKRENEERKVDEYDKGKGKNSKKKEEKEEKGKSKKKGR